MKAIVGVALLAVCAFGHIQIDETPVKTEQLFVRPLTESGMKTVGEWNLLTVQEIVQHPLFQVYYQIPLFKQHFTHPLFQVYLTTPQFQNYWTHPVFPTFFQNSVLFYKYIFPQVFHNVNTPVVNPFFKYTNIETPTVNPMFYKNFNNKMYTNIDKTPIFDKMMWNKMYTNTEYTPIVDKMMLNKMYTTIDNTPIVNKMMLNKMYTTVDNTPIVDKMMLNKMYTTVDNTPIVDKMMLNKMYTNIDTTPIVDKMMLNKMYTTVDNTPIVDKVLWNKMYTTVDTTPIVDKMFWNKMYTTMDNTPIVDKFFNNMYTNNVNGQIVNPFFNNMYKYNTMNTPVVDQVTPMNPFFWMNKVNGQVNYDEVVRQILGQEDKVNFQGYNWDKVIKNTVYTVEKPEEVTEVKTEVNIPVTKIDESPMETIFAKDDFFKDVKVDFVKDDIKEALIKKFLLENMTQGKKTFGMNRFTKMTPEEYLLNKKMMEIRHYGNQIPTTFTNTMGSPMKFVYPTEQIVG